MFCPLEHIHIDTEVCPISMCLYRASNGSCHYRDLLNEAGITAEQISSIKDLKLYKVKEESQIGRHNLAVGMIIDKYVDFITNSFPSPANQPVNITDNDEDRPTARLLHKVFGLTTDQQLMFWSKTRFDDWRLRQKIEMEIDLPLVFKVLKEVSS